MAGYLGNPQLVMMAQDSVPVANFIYPADPTTTTNPNKLPCSWLNSSTGALFVCTDNTTDANVWVEVGSSVHKKYAVVYRSTSLSVTNNSWTPVPFDTEYADTGGFYSSGTPSRFTIPAGVSLVKLNFQGGFSANTTGRRQLRISVNGDVLVPWGLTSVANMDVSYPEYFGVSSPPVAVVEGDYFDAEVYQNSGSNLDLAGGTLCWFSIEVLA